MELTASRLRELLHYDPETGMFTWKDEVRERRAVKPGQRAGIILDNGYLQIGVDRKKYQAHRLAWLYMTGEWPPHQVDHIDLNKSNNIWTNLRSATRSQNMANIAAKNRLGVKGVTKVGKAYRADIFSNGKMLYLGTYATIEAASAAYFERAKQLHGEFARAA